MSYNKVILKGRIGQELKNQNGAVKFSLATDESYVNRDGNKVEKTAWHNIVSFGKVNEVLLKYFTKGSEILVEGKLTYNEYEGKTFTSIQLQSFDFVGSSKQSEQPKRERSGIEQNFVNEILQEMEDDDDFPI